MIFSDIPTPTPLQNDDAEWDMTTGGVFGQRDDVGVDDHSDVRMIRITVFHHSSQHDLLLPAESTFGDVKRLLVHKTGLKPEEQTLFFRGNERQNEEHLHLEGVKDKSRMFVFESPFSQVSKLEQSRNHLQMSKASEAVAGVRTEVDKLSERLAALEVAVNGETKIAENEFIMLAELLMRQLLKLDTIEAEGEARLQRKAEVCRVQNLVDTLDSLKERNSKPSSNNGNASSVTTEETFPSGMGSLNAPPLMSSSGKVTPDLKQSDYSANREFKLPGRGQSMDTNIRRALARKRVRHSDESLGKAGDAKYGLTELSKGAQVQFEQRVENKTTPLEDPQSSHQRESKEEFERGTTSQASGLEEATALAQPKVHINEHATTKDAQTQIKGEIIRKLLVLKSLSRLKPDDDKVGNGDVINAIPQVVSQTEETTSEHSTRGEIPTPTNPHAEIAHKNFFPISAPMQNGFPTLTVPPAEIARKAFFSSILAPTQGAPSQEGEVLSGEPHSHSSAQPPIAGESTTSAESVIRCPIVGRQGLYYPPPAFFTPPPLGQITPSLSTSKYSSEEATYVNVTEILKLISPSSTNPTSHSPVSLAATAAPASATSNVARSVAELCGLDDKVTKLMETAFNKYPNLMIIRSDRRKTFIRWMFRSLSDLLQLLSTASTGTLDVPKMTEIENVLRELETFGFDAGFIYEMRLQVREARFAIDNANFDLKALCSKAEELNLEIEIMESNIAAAKAEVAQVEAKINTLCDFVEDNRTPVFKWIQ
ncbi:BAG family molecular chaperone regulator 4-like [Senna tora]|uniref:BAG family molecular chaperone regulator 4-like n=1 Tax=Senna tora TaxID=362788 RepID=A0A834TWN7_9FABA|nr:BAG family molecular chaperone regulator 4-like [Senna tora]